MSYCIAAPVGQGSPVVTEVGSNSVSLKWTNPQTPNGPVPPSYNVSRATAAFNEPPQEVTAGVHFPGLGYYKFPSDVITQGDRNDIEFSFRTQHPNGLIIFMASDDKQEDLLAVELRDGKPWVVFDCQSGPASFTVTDNKRFDDSQWHHAKLTRTGESGTLTIDNKYSGTGKSGQGSTVIGGYKAVYVGGLPKDFKYERSDSGNAKLNLMYFIGCLKNVKSGNKEFQWDKSLEKSGVNPQRNGCPVRMKSTGALLRGGGFFAIKSELFKGGSLFPFKMTFRTQMKSGLLAFAYGPSAYIGLVLQNGTVTLKLKGTNNYTSYNVPSSSLCDGNWQTVQVVSFSAINFVIIINEQTHTLPGITGISLQSKLYIGGIPLEDAQAVQQARDAGIDPEQTFSGCVKELMATNAFVLGRDVIERRNVDLDGCVSDEIIQASLKRGSCLSMDSKTLVTQTGLQYTDFTVNPFVGK